MGPVRSWIFRAMILAVLAGLAAAGWVMHDWVSPERVREAVLASLREQFPDCQVQIASARLRLFGGICVSDWTLTRQGDTEPFFKAESAVIAHDKEQLNHGRVTIRKIELDGPVLNIERLADGSWNIDKLFKEGPADQSVPTVTIRNATINLKDARTGGLPPLVIQASKLHLLNDPIQTLKAEIQATLKPKTTEKTSLELVFLATMKRNRVTHHTQIRVEVPSLNFTPELAPVLGRFSPELAEHFGQLYAQLGLKADLVLVPGQPLKHDIKLEVKDGRLDDPELPTSVEHLSAIVQVKDGKVIVEKGTAKLGRANAEFSLETRDSQASQVAKIPAILPASVNAATTTDPIKQIEDKLERLEITLRDLVLDDEFFNRLPPAARGEATKIRRMFSPNGSIDVTSKFQRTGTGWRREIEVVPNRLTVTYEHFKYAIHDVSGWVKKVIASDGTDEYRMQVTGSAGGKRVELSGRIHGTGPDPQIDLKIAGTDIPIDDKLFNGLSEKHSKILNKLRATARGDFVIDIKQPLGVNRCENSFRVRIYDGTVNYVNFPYELQKLKGMVLIQVATSDQDRPLKPGLPLVEQEDTNRVELREFEAVHGNSKLWFSGHYEPIPESKDHRFCLRLQGERVALDDDLRAALSSVKAGDLWAKLQPRGAFTFGADFEMLDRSPGKATPPPPVQQQTSLPVVPTVAVLPGDPDFNPVTDLKLIIKFLGPTVTPAFFPYELQDVEGVVRYVGGKLDLARFQAKHGVSRFYLDAGQVLFGERGEVWANLGGIAVKPLVPDPVLIEALPAKMRSGVTALKLRGAMDLTVKQLVIKIPPVPETPLARGQSPSPLPLPIGAPLPLPPVITQPDPVIFWDTELRLAGVSCSAGVEIQDAHGVLASAGRYEGNALGSVVGNAWLDRITVSKVPLSATKFNYRIRPQTVDANSPTGFTAPVLEFPEMTGLLFSGTINGEARLELAEKPRYRVMLTASNVKLEDIAAHCKLNQQAELRGLAQGRFYLENVPDPRTGQLIASGTGQVDIPSGRMLNLPVLLPLLKLLKLQTPDQTAFEEAHALFELKGDRVTVSQLDLIGTAVSLGGWGELDTKGEDIRFEFYTIWSQVLKRWLSTPFGDVTSFLSGNLFKIEMTRKNGEMNYKPVMLPAITEPVRGVAERLRNRFSR